MSDVDYFVKDVCKDKKHELEMKEKKGMYPPRFHVVLSCFSSARQSQSKIEFREAVTENLTHSYNHISFVCTYLSKYKYPM